MQVCASNPCHPVPARCPTAHTTLLTGGWVLESSSSRDPAEKEEPLADGYVSSPFTSAPPSRRGHGALCGGVPRGLSTRGRAVSPRAETRAELRNQMQPARGTPAAAAGAGAGAGLGRGERGLSVRAAASAAGTAASRSAAAIAAATAAARLSSVRALAMGRRRCFVLGGTCGGGGFVCGGGTTVCGERQHRLWRRQQRTQQC